MEQLIEYSNIKTLSDIPKTFAEIPCTIRMADSGIPKFTIANYEEFKATVARLASQYDSSNVVITQNNVATYEHDASTINKLIKQVKSDCKAFVDEFALEMLGRNGRYKVKGQVQEITEILQNAYDVIHTKTVEYRDLQRVDKTEESTISGEILSQETTQTFSVKVPLSKIEDFKNYCQLNGIVINDEISVK